MLRTPTNTEVRDENVQINTHQTQSVRQLGPQMRGRCSGRAPHSVVERPETVTHQGLVQTPERHRQTYSRRVCRTAGSARQTDSKRLRTQNLRSETLKHAEHTQQLLTKRRVRSIRPKSGFIQVGEHSSFDTQSLTRFSSLTLRKQRALVTTQH